MDPPTELPLNDTAEELARGGLIGCLERGGGGEPSEEGGDEGWR